MTTVWKDRKALWYLLCPTPCVLCDMRWSLCLCLIFNVRLDWSISCLLDEIQFVNGYLLDLMWYIVVFIWYILSGILTHFSSLTEAFCIAIVEAACCGLLTVSTKVGGVPEACMDSMALSAELKWLFTMVLGLFVIRFLPPGCFIISRPVTSDL